jgi:PBP1b-binding outer membrane lipoprotein LpoB
MTDMRYIAAILLISFISGCASQIDPALVKQRQLQMQRMQTRVFDTNDRKTVTRGVIATMQDLDFIINNLDVEQGIVSAKRFGTYPIDMTVTIQPISSKQILVHGIAQYNLKTIEDPFLYEQFFSSLQKLLPFASHRD